LEAPLIKDRSKVGRPTPNSLGKVRIERKAEKRTPILVFLVRYLLGRFGWKVRAQTYRFIDYFRGFDQVEVVRKILSDETEAVLNELRIEFVSRMGYMGVSDIDGHIVISADYLRHGDLKHIYLDIIHELVHVKQFREGRKLFDRRYGYTERATEIEAYQYTVEEARNIGMNDEEIFLYLKTEWMSRDSHRRLAETLNVGIEE
jgi:hypothetical protein